MDASMLVPPGEILKEEFLDPLGMTAADIVTSHVSLEYIDNLIAGAASITPEAAQLFADTFGTSPEFWFRLQTAHDRDVTQATH